VHSPVRLELKFEGRGGAQVNVETLKLVYVKSPAVDLTDRIKAFAKPAGISVPAAELPPGTHTIRAEIKDKDGRAGFFSFQSERRELNRAGASDAVPFLRGRYPSRCRDLPVLRQ